MNTACSFVDWPILAARAAAEKTNDATVVLDVGDLLGITGSFVISSAGNARRVRAVVDHIEETLTLAGGPKPIRIEGLSDLRWVLMDYGDFVVHVFDDQAREFYDLERLWGDAPRIEWQSDGSPGSSGV